jgi:hypothetical protein
VRRFNEGGLGSRGHEGPETAPAEFSEVFEPHSSRPSSNKRLKVEVGGFEPPSPGDLSGLLRAQPAV